MPDTPDDQEEQQTLPPLSSRMSSNRTAMMILACLTLIPVISAFADRWS